MSTQNESSPAQNKGCRRVKLTLLLAGLAALAALVLLCGGLVILLRPIWIYTLISRLEYCPRAWEQGINCQLVD